LLMFPLTGCEPTADSGSSTTTPKKSAEPADDPIADEVTTQPAVTVEKPKLVPTELPADVERHLGPLRIPADNPMTPEKIALGKKLYFDKRLSKDGTISCATCHDPEMAWTEHLATSKGIGDQIGTVNSPTVINSAYATAQFWDGRAETLEEQALGPIENPIEMGHKLDVLVKELAAIPEYEEAFQKVFGTSVTSDGIGKAIAAFERTVLSHNSPYDKFNDGDKDALSESQKRGLELFEDTGCADCHQPPVFSNHRYYNAGVGMDNDPPDEGRKAVTKKDSDLGKFRVPMLREVANTGPYFHDGSVDTLEADVELMDAGGKENDNLSGMMKAMRATELSGQDKKDIVAFLESLSGEYPRQ
jgi:cytochrome c peroxidase